MMRVFVGETVSQSPTWTESTAPLPLRPEGTGPRRLLRAFANAVTTTRQVSAQDVVIFTDEHPVSANLYALRPRLGRRRPTLIRTDPLFQTPGRAWRRRYLQAIAARVDGFVVWAEATAERYHRVLGIPRAKMTAVPFHHTLHGQCNLAVTDGDYVFSGGNSMRDYTTFLEAVRGLPIPVRIATHWQPPAGLTLPDNVRLGPASHNEFFALLAGARLVVLPLQMDNLRTSGQQSYLNAMALGKAVIVTDTEDAPFYIDHGRTGLLTPPAQPQALREALLSLWDSPQRLRVMGEQARQVAAPMDQENTWRQVLAVALQVHQRRLAGPSA
jgi:hypothetical protein